MHRRKDIGSIRFPAVKADQAYGNSADHTADALRRGIAKSHERCWDWVRSRLSKHSEKLPSKEQRAAIDEEFCTTCKHRLHRQLEGKCHELNHEENK